MPLPLTRLYGFVHTGGIYRPAVQTSTILLILGRLCPKSRALHGNKRFVGLFLQAASVQELLKEGRSGCPYSERRI